MYQPEIFREYDIRGIVGRDFDAAFAYTLGRALAAALPRSGAAPPRLSVGRDCRLSSPELAAALRSGIRDGGAEVFDLGLCPTPLLYFSLFTLPVGGGVQVTGSHNPADQNGFKICVGRRTLHGPEIRALRALVDQVPADRPPRSAARECRVDIVARYHEALLARLPRARRPIRVVVDAGNGTAGPVAPALLRALGHEVVELFCVPDGRFPHHHPDPTVPENLAPLRAAVTEHAADVGLAFDGDADRLGVVDADGRILWGDELLVLFARDVLARHPGAVVIGEVKCSERVFDDIARRGGRPVMWKAGHSLIKAKMQETGALLAGEMSGHFFFADDYFGYDDAIYAACRLLDVLGRADAGPGALIGDLPPVFATPEVRVPCPDAVKAAVVARVAEHEVFNFYLLEELLFNFFQIKIIKFVIYFVKGFKKFRFNILAFI